MIDFPLEMSPRKRIHADFSRVARADVAELSFFVIGVHPNVALNQRNHLGAWTNQLSRAHLAFAHDSVFWRCDPRVTQIDPRQRRAKLSSHSNQSEAKFLRVQYSTLALLRFEFGLVCFPSGRAPEPDRLGGLLTGPSPRPRSASRLASCARKRSASATTCSTFCRVADSVAISASCRRRSKECTLHVRFGPRRFRCAH